MSDSETIDRDQRTGRFVAGNAGNGGRRPGQRNKLGEAFIADLRDAWEQHGSDVIARVARDDPAALLKVIASLMPKDINLNVGVDAASFAERFRSAYALLGNEPPQRMPKLPKVIDHAG